MAWSHTTRTRTPTSCIAEAAMALSDDTSPVFVARAMNTFGSIFMDMQKTAAAFRGDGVSELGRPPPVPLLRVPSGSSGPDTGPT